MFILEGLPPLEHDQLPKLVSALTTFKLPSASPQRRVHILSSPWPPSASSFSLGSGRCWQTSWPRSEGGWWGWSASRRLPRAGRSLWPWCTRRPPAWSRSWSWTTGRRGSLWGRRSWMLWKPLGWDLMEPKNRETHTFKQQKNKFKPLRVF